MTCTKVSKLIEDFILEELTEEQKKMVSDHLEHCAKCHKQYEMLKKATNSLKQWSDSIEVPGYLDKNIESAILAEAKSKLKTQSKGYKKGAAYLVAAVLLVTVSWGVWAETDIFQSSMEKDVVLNQDVSPKEELMTMQGTAESYYDNGMADSTEQIEPENRGLLAEPETLQSSELDEPKETESITMTRDSAVVMGLGEAQQQPMILFQEVENIKVTSGGDVYLIGKEHQQLVKMMVQGINEAGIVKNAERLNDNAVTHIIYIQFADGSDYKVSYNLNNNSGVIEDVTITPGPTLTEAMEALLTN